MSVEKNNKDPIEQFFQKKSEEYDITYREEDWLKLEKQLDLRDAQVAYRRKVLWMAAAALLAVSLLGYFTMDNYLRLNELNRLLTDDIATPGELIPGEPTPGASVAPGADEDAGTVDDPGATGISDAAGAPDAAGTPATGVQERIDDGAFLTDPEDMILYPDPAAPFERDPAEPAFAGGSPRDPVDPGSQRLLTGVPNVSVLALAGPGDREDVYARSGRKHEKVQVIASGAVYSVFPEDLGADAPEQITDHEPLALSQADFETDERHLPVRSRFSFSLVTAPDLSTVNSLSGFYDPGFKAGITAEYRLTSRVSLSTGIVPSVVRYSAENTDYNPSGYNYGNSSGRSTMTGECLLFDIPVSLVYELFDFGRSGIFVSAGLSSYIMLSEEYSFRFEGDTERDAETWSDRTGTRHWFSNAGVSVGYERDISRNISLRVEPYARIPVREVGWANVRLYSVGSFFSLRYRL